MNAKEISDKFQEIIEIDTFLKEYVNLWVEGERYMLFKDLQEGKKYRVVNVLDNSYMMSKDRKIMEDTLRGQILTLKDGLLCNSDGYATGYSMLDVKYFEFIKVTEFVGFKTAFNAMFDGKICSFYNVKYKLVDEKLCEYRPEKRDSEQLILSSLNKSMFEDKKWVILDD